MSFLLILILILWHDKDPEFEVEPKSSNSSPQPVQPPIASSLSTPPSTIENAQPPYPDYAGRRDICISRVLSKEKKKTWF